jgi:hypothetical protein
MGGALIISSIQHSAFSTQQSAFSPETYVPNFESMVIESVHALLLSAPGMLWD